MNGCEGNEAKRHFVIKKAFFDFGTETETETGKFKYRSSLVLMLRHRRSERKWNTR
jgi:hypothetical protein